MHQLLPASIWGCWVCVVGVVIYRQTTMTVSFIQTRIYNPCLKNAHLGSWPQMEDHGKKSELLIHANEATKLGEKCEKIQNEKLKVFLECTSEHLYIETGLRPKTGYYQSEGKPVNQCMPHYNLPHSWKIGFWVGFPSNFRISKLHHT